jgi:hypothetical protein
MMPRIKQEILSRVNVSPNIRTPSPTIKTGIVSDRIAALDADECEMPHESITDGGTIPKTPRAINLPTVPHSNLFPEDADRFLSNHGGISKDDANRSVQKFNAADSISSLASL